MRTRPFDDRETTLPVDLILRKRCGCIISFVFWKGLAGLLDRGKRWRVAREWAREWDCVLAQEHGMAWRMVALYET